MAKKSKRHSAPPPPPPTKEDWFYSLLEQFFEKNLEDVVKNVNDEFNATNEMYDNIVAEICKIISPQTPHYEWTRGDCPYDQSGELVQDGTIDLSQTISNLLENEYTGDWSPSYQSGWGKNYNTFDEPLSHVSLNTAFQIMEKAARECAVKWVESLTQEEFEEYPTISSELSLDEVKDYTASLSDEGFSGIFSDIYDPIYSESIASDFFFPKLAVEFIGIENKRLCEILKL